VALRKGFLGLEAESLGAERGKNEKKAIAQSEKGPVPLVQYLSS